MARKINQQAQKINQPLELAVPREDAKSRLQDRIEKGLELKSRSVNSQSTYQNAKDDFDKWNAFNCELLKRIFTTDELSQEYDQTWPSHGLMYFDSMSLSEEIAHLNRNIDKKIHSLESIIERLELIPLSGADSKISASDSLQAKAHVRTRKVFVVHGRDDLSKTSLEVFLRENGFEPIVLHRQADEGMTIIEKFEKHSDVGYAFILLTPDEIGYLATEDLKNDTDRAKEYRARPNVIFEFGYFIGKLGRSRVCCLYTGNVTLPSDVSGMIYKRFEKNIEEVAYSIIKDLRASGYAIH